MTEKTKIPKPETTSKEAFKRAYKRAYKVGLSLTVEELLDRNSPFNRLVREAEVRRLKILSVSTMTNVTDDIRNAARQRARMLEQELEDEI
jgi:hypothetical protein